MLRTKPTSLSWRPRSQASTRRTSVWFSLSAKMTHRISPKNSRKSGFRKCSPSMKCRVLQLATSSSSMVKRRTAPSQRKAASSKPGYLRRLRLPRGKPESLRALTTPHTSRMRMILKTKVSLPFWKKRLANSRPWSRIKGPHNNSVRTTEAAIQKCVAWWWWWWWPSNNNPRSFVHRNNKKVVVAASFDLIWLEFLVKIIAPYTFILMEFYKKLSIISL